MNYSERDLNIKIKHISSPKRRIINRMKLCMRLAFVVLALAVILSVSFGVVGIVRGLIDSAPAVNELDMMPDGYATTIYDSGGQKIQTLVGSDANRVYKTIDKIPESVQHAFVAVEDSRFYEHKGVDMQGIIRAVYSGITDNGIDQGASTITQQLLKNQVFGGGNETSFFGKLSRKIQEQCLAVELEDEMDKNQILEYYLNTINLGQNTLGVEAASKRYFDKSVSDLTISEAAVLAGITQNPTEYNPITNQDNNATKRKIVLKDMLDQGYISEDEYEDALGDDVYTRITEVNKDKTSSKSEVNSYYVDAVIDSVVEDLKQKLGYTETQAYNAIYRGGLKIYTCQDQSIQNVCDNVINDDSYYPADTTKYLSYQLNVKNSEGDMTQYSESDIKSYFSDIKGEKISLYFKSKKKAKKYIKEFKKNMLLESDEIVSESVNFIKQPQASFVLMDQSTGKVRALVGGRGEKTANRTFNRATSSKRQPGSTFKVLSTYLPALDTCGMTLATVQDDAPYKYPGTNTKVSDWDSTGYKGLTTLRDGIVDSINVVTVKTFEQVTPQTGYDYLLNLGFSTLVDKRESEDGKIYSDIQLPTALGGLTDGVTNLELTAAYASIANGGTYIEPIFYTKIVDQDGNILIDNEPDTKRVMKESTAWLLTDAMEDVITDGTGKAVAFDNSDIAEAGKTGTTSDNTDYWFEGYTPYYTAGIWTGYDQDFSQTEGNYHKKMWKAIMEKVNKIKKLKSKDFQMPSDIVTAKICTKCGLLAVDGLCDQAEDGSDVRTEFFAKGTEPTKSCSCHVKYTVSKSTGQIVSDSTSVYDQVTKVFLQKDESGYSEATADTPYLAPN